MNSLLRIWSVVTIAAKRLLAQRGLALATLLGLAAAAALTTSIPLYAEAVYYRVLTEGLFSDTPRYRGRAFRPPVALLFRYVGSFTGPVQWETVQPLDRYFAEQVYRDLRLPPSPDAQGVRMFNTGLFGIFAEVDADVVTTKPALFSMSLACLGTLETRLKIVEGRFPAAGTADHEAIEVLLSRAFADEMGTQVGENYIAYDTRAQRKYKPDPAKFRMRVVGVWEPADPRAEFWEYTQIPLDNLLFVSESTFAERISPALTDEIYQAMWYMPMDAAEVYVTDVKPLLDRIQDLQGRVMGFLPNTTLDVSPVKVLTSYRDAANTLTILLLAFSVPILTLILAFIALVVALTAERHRNEVATLRSRGATAPQVVSVTVLEGAILGALALGAALPASMLLAYSIGQARSFLDFTLATDLRVGLTWATVRFGVAMVVLTLAALILPMLGIARQTIVTYKRERARTLRPPWWQRAWLDVLLLVPVAYGTYILSQQGSVLPSAADVPADPFQDPLLFIVPALGLSACVLFSLRVLPLLTRVLAWIGSYARNLGLLLALRQLSRAPRHYAAPLGLLMLTLSLSTYTASLSTTLERHLHDHQYYWVGADVSLIDLGDNPEATGGLGSGSQDSGGRRETFWRFPPVSDYLKIPGVRDATRVGLYQARIQTGESYQAGTFIGVDRADLARVAFWRGDFAPEPLGTLMNRLAVVQDGVLLPRDFMRANLLETGDRVNVAVNAYDHSANVSFEIAGVFDLFPTWYPETGPLVVGNLDNFFDQAQMQVPYRVWLKTAPGVDYNRLADQAWEISLGAQGMLASYPRILAEQRQPERQGLFGLLSVGFGAAAVMTALGFTLYVLSSFQRRAVELGVLRAIGLSRWQMTVFIICEQGFLLLVGGAVGTGLGVWASHTFIPYLQIGAEAISRVPPFVVEIAWPALWRVYALFGLLFAIALAVLVRLLWRMKLFQAIKLGEAL